MCRSGVSALFYGTYQYPPRWGVGGAGTDPVHITVTREYREITRPFWDPEFLAQAAGQEDRPGPDAAVLVVRNERDMLEVDRRLAGAALTNIESHKLIQLHNIPRHFYALWRHPSAWWCVDLPKPLDIVWLGCYLAFLVLFAGGVCVAWKSGKLAVIPLSWLILMAGHTCVLLVLHAECRFQVFSAIFVYIFSGLGAATIHRFPRRERRP